MSPPSPSTMGPQAALPESSEAGLEEPGQSVEQALVAAARRLESAVESPRMEAEILLAHLLCAPRSRFRAYPEAALVKTTLDAYLSLVDQRRNGVPVAYLTGTREFWSIEFEVDDSVLIPRHETERLVETALALLPKGRRRGIAEIGTGCGAVAVALAKERPECTVIATDASCRALAVARRNLRRAGTSNVLLVAGHWLMPFDAARLDIVVSNPPYIAADDPHLSQGDLRFEPRSALDAGVDGMDAIRDLISQAPRCLKPGGHLLFEHGFEQGAQARELLAAAGYGAIVTHEDYAGRERVTQACWRV